MDDKILSAATEIQTHLSELLKKKQAQLVSQQLRSLLAKAKKGEEVDVDILDLLGDYPTTQQWMENRIKEISSQAELAGKRDVRFFSLVPGNHTPPPPVDDKDDPKPK